MEKAIEKLSKTMADLQECMKELKMEVERERKELRTKQEELEEKIKCFEEERRRVHQVLDDSEPVQLNIGGQLFTTSSTTLRNAPEPSLFSAMFSGRHPLKKDKMGCIFLDRDGRHFHDILNYLRDKSFSYAAEKHDYKYLLELKAEAEFYGLVGLSEQIDKYPYNMKTLVRASSINTDDSWMYEDGQDEIVFSVDKECQLLGAGLCGTEGGMTVELEIMEVDREDFSFVHSSLETSIQTFTKSDGEIVSLFFDKPCLLSSDKVYMLSALIKGSESHCCEDCMECCVAAGVRFNFHVWESPNGTNEQRGQFPELYIRAK